MHTCAFDKTRTADEILALVDQGAIVEVLDQVFMASAETWKENPLEWDSRGQPVEQEIMLCDYWIKTIPEQAKETIFLIKQLAAEGMGKWPAVKMLGGDPSKKIMVCVPWPWVHVEDLKC